MANGNEDRTGHHKSLAMMYLKIARFAHSLAFHVLIPIVLFSLIIGIALAVFTFFAISTFVGEQANTDLQWRTFTIYNLIDSSFDDLQRTGKLNDQVALLDHRVKAMMAIESFARVNKLGVTLRDLSNQTTIELTQQKDAQQVTSTAGKIMSHVFPSFYRQSFRTIRFEPWQWEINLQQSNEHYLTLFSKLLWGAGLAALLFVIGISCFMFYLTRVAWKPIKKIIHDLANNESPSYKGVTEFEYLSESIANMMGAIHEHSGRLEAEVTERTAALTERTMQLDRAKEAAEEASRAKSAFLANMSHELRTPLNAVLGYAQLLKREPNLSERQVTGLSTIQQSGDHLLVLINDILDLSRVEAGRLELYPVTIDLATLLQSISDIVRVKAEEKRLVFLFEALPELPEFVSIDDKRLRQVLLNLLGNAVKFTDQGTVSFRVHMVSLTNSMARLRFEVTDTGPGIHSDQFEKIFQPFEQAGDVQHRFSGSGLGLAISRQLLRLMGGDITVKSTIGEGSCFAFEIEMPTEKATRTVAPSERTAIGYRGPRKRVLVVDDILGNRILIVDFLTLVGFEMFEAESGQRAVEQARQLHPDLIIMDMVMPSMDGLEAIGQIKQLPNLGDIPIIAMSASASASEEQKSLAKANVFLPKPVEFNKLLQFIGDLLHVSWIYEEHKVIEPENADATLMLPPVEELRTLQHLAMIGNMRDIRNWADHLITKDINYRPFVEKLHLLIEKYESENILNMVTEYLREADTPSLNKL